MTDVFNYHVSAVLRQIYTIRFFRKILQINRLFCNLLIETFSNCSNSAHGGR